MSNNGDLQEPLIERLSSTPEPKSIVRGKRKRGSSTVAVAKISERSKQTKKQKISDDGDLDLELNINRIFSQMNDQLLADYVAQKTRKFESDLSSIELEDRYLSASTIRDTTAWSKPRNIDNLPAFLESFAKNPTKLWSASKKNGAPHTIIVAGAGLRAADIARVIRKFQSKEAVVAKLFAKHIKIKDAIKFLQSTRTGIAVGTPMRLDALMEDGALSVDKVERIVIDASHIDRKKRGILEMKETQVPLTQWLNRKELKEKLGSSTGGIDLLFY